jgi:hypothetical protein
LLWYGRVELFFRCTFKNYGGRLFEVDLALLSFLYDFKCPAAMTILQKEAGDLMFYEPVCTSSAMSKRAKLRPVYFLGGIAATYCEKFLP